MKILNFLKNKAGKLVIGAPQMLTIAGVGMMATYGAFKTDQILDNDVPLRALSSVAASSTPYEGLNRRADGMLTSMNIQNRAGGKGVAVGADRERLEGNTSKNDFGLSAADNLENNFSISGVGSAARTSSSEGLGTGGVDMKEIPAGAGTRGSYASGATSVSVPQGSSAPAASTGNSGGKLASASMARASGNSFNASSGSVGGGASGGGAAGGRSGGSSRSSGSESYNFSGAMPSGSNVVSSYTSSLGGRGSGATFLAGGRNATTGRGGRRVNEKDDLKQISKMSAEVAKDRNRGTTSGARPFLANTATSAGMSIEGGADESRSAGSADFSTPEARNLKAIGDWGQKQEDDANDRSKARTRLMWMTLALIAATIAAIPVVYRIISLAKKAGVFAAGGIGLGVALAAVVMAYAAVVMGFAISYLAKYKGNMFLPILSVLMGGAAITMMAITIKNALANTGKEGVTKETLKKQSYYKGALSLGKKAAVTAGTTVGTSTIQKAMSDK